MLTRTYFILYIFFFKVIEGCAWLFGTVTLKYLTSLAFGIADDVSSLIWISGLSKNFKFLMFWFWHLTYTLSWNSKIYVAEMGGGLRVCFFSCYVLSLWGVTTEVCEKTNVFTIALANSLCVCFKMWIYRAFFILDIFYLHVFFIYSIS